MSTIDFSTINLFTTKEGRKITYQDLLSDIYENSSESRETMRTLIEQMASLIQSPADAVLLMEHIAMLMDTRVKNDDLLVKVAAIVARIIQRSMERTEEGQGWEISEEEKKQLLQEANDLLNRAPVKVEISKDGNKPR